MIPPPARYRYKVRRLALAHEHLQSSDSLAWSYRAHRSPSLPECEHVSCQNGLRFALRWRARLLQFLGMPSDVQERFSELRLF